MSAPLLHLSGVGKDYAKLDTDAARVKLVLDLLRGRGVARAFCALDDVSFDLAAGESLGIIGENGAGKSTLLKIVAGVITPTRGSVDVRGRVGALLELGSGFHPEYSGFANIDLAAALLGLTPGEIAEKRDEIVAFADIGEHIHDPIKHYSSGMVVRLGFAVATALRPDILITDEVLAVGDESFQKKCVAWMENYLAGGGTLLLCSHSMYHVQKLCRAALWLKDGRMMRYGPAAEVAQAYLVYHEEKSAGARKPIASPQASAAGYYAIQSLILDPPERIASGGALAVAGEVYSPDDRAPVVLVGLVRVDGTPIYGVATDMDGVTPERIGAQRFAFSLTFPQLPLLPGKYIVRAHALDPEGLRLFDNVEQSFIVEGTSRELGLVRIGHGWNGGDPR
ncbi:MAG TPA: ABC transporter ATP-binding protein [Casimicrobiaceae bacterium]|jgi:lipopolysaccharide transport system ATP-binding protein